MLNKINIGFIRALVKRDLWRYFTNPTGYVVADHQTRIRAPEPEQHQHVAQRENCFLWRALRSTSTS